MVVPVHGINRLSSVPCQSTFVYQEFLNTKSQIPHGTITRENRVYTNYDTEVRLYVACLPMSDAGDRGKKKKKKKKKHPEHD